MSRKNKNYNSIIFLTTLSVYLSISLLGATPQVLAYAATTRNFDIQTEIEYQDDLDNKPDSEEAEQTAEDNLPKFFSRLLLQLQEESQFGGIKPSISHAFQPSRFVFSNANNINSVTFGDNHLSFLDSSIKRFQKDSSLNKHSLNELSAFKTDYENSRQIPFDEANAQQFADFLNREINSSVNTAEKLLPRSFYENAKLTSENNQIFVVTRLPRAAIDSLIK